MTTQLASVTTDVLNARNIALIARKKIPLLITAGTELRVQRARDVLESHAQSNRPVYGLNTALGAGVDTPLDASDLVEFQRRVPFGHAAGAGPALPQDVVRAAMAARIAGMAAGGTGISPAVFHGLVAALNAGVHPVVPSWGSIGAADLVPMAHISASLLGYGQAEYAGEIMPSQHALDRAGLLPLPLGIKDGHALVVANSLSIGHACLVLSDLERLFDWTLRGVALDYEAFRANLSVLDEQALAARPAFGQQIIGQQLRALMTGSALHNAGEARRIQDPLSYRCVPQSLGALRHALDEALQATEIELASSGDNPVVLPDYDKIVSHGNFDMMAFVLSWERLGQALSHNATAIAHRLLKLMSAAISDLPRFLAPEGQNRSGFAVLQKTLAALEAEIRFLAHPISLSPLAVSDGVEDQSSMAPRVIEKTARIVEHMRCLVAAELLVSAYAVEMRGTPLDTLGQGAAQAYYAVRANADPLHDGRMVSEDLAAIITLISSNN